MSTRCLMGITEDIKSDRMTCVYCSHDGYPEGVGATLLSFYDTDEKIRRMMEGGDMSSLGDSPDQCDYYNEGDYAAASRIRISSVHTDIEYCYAFDRSTQTWWVWNVFRGELGKLSDVVAKRNNPSVLIRAKTVDQLYRELQKNAWEKLPVSGGIRATVKNGYITLEPDV